MHRTAMRRAVILATPALALLALSGCGHSGGPATYLATSGTAVALIQWQESSSGHLQGTIFEDQVSGTALSETIYASSRLFTGSVNGSSVSLTLSGLFGIEPRVSGTLSGNTLTLQVRQNDGTVQQATFTAAGFSDFQKAAAALLSRIQNANNVAAAAQAQAQQQQQAGPRLSDRTQRPEHAPAGPGQHRRRPQDRALATDQAARQLPSRTSAGRTIRTTI
jgi:hypothetical protein